MKFLLLAWASCLSGHYGLSRADEQQQQPRFRSYGSFRNELAMKAMTGAPIVTTDPNYLAATVVAALSYTRTL